MELFKLIICITILFFFNLSVLVDTILIYLFLMINYKTNINYDNNVDPIIMTINLINIIMHLIIYQFNNFVKAINKTKYGILIIYSYDYLDSKVIQIKNLIFYQVVLNPIKFVIGKTIGTIYNNDIIKELKVNNINQNNVIKKTISSSEVTLETNDDIYNFLNKLEKNNLINNLVIQ